MKVRQPAAATVETKRSSAASLSWSSMPIRHLTVTGTATARLHGGDAFGHQRGLGHQAGAEAALLHPVGRAADIEIDLGIAEILAPARGLGQQRRIAAAKLQRHRGSRGSKPSRRRRSPWRMAWAVDHFGVKQRARA